MNRKYTLIEFLVLISLVLIIISLLSPSLKKIIHHSEIVNCKNNLKSQVLGVLFYSEDYYGFLPLSAYQTRDKKDVDRTMYWAFQIKDYIGISAKKTRDINAKGTVLECPSNEFTSLPKKFGGYGYNWNYLGNYSENLQEPRGRKNLFNADLPRDTIVTGDTYSILDVDQNLTWKFGQLDSPIKAISEYRRHSSSFNVSWLDGHVTNDIWFELSQGKKGDTEWYYRLKKRVASTNN